MTRQRALRLAREWSQGHVCSLRDGEAAEYHTMFAAMLEEAPPNEPLTLEQLLEMDNIPIWVVDITINRWEWCYWKDGFAYSCEAHPEYYDPDEYGLWLAYRRPKEGKA